MTDRAEIERLLQMTGRTLEGLPTQSDYLYADDHIEKHEEIGEMMWAAKFTLDEPYIQHQSDVIELLVGALRDALDKPMQKLMTYDETLVAEGPVWVESKIPGVLDDWFYAYGGDDKEIELLTFGVKENWIKAKAMYNRTWRCWAYRPTDEEREAAAWEG